MTCRVIDGVPFNEWGDLMWSTCRQRFAAGSFPMDMHAARWKLIYRITCFSVSSSLVYIHQIYFRFVYVGVGQLSAICMCTIQKESGEN